MTSLKGAAPGLMFVSTGVTICLINYITVVSKNQLMWYIKQNRTEEEEEHYYAGEDYDLHLNYLIDSWVSIIENDFKSDSKYDGNFNYICQVYDKGFYFPKFNDNLLDDIFVRNILVTSAVCLK